MRKMAFIAALAVAASASTVVAQNTGGRGPGGRGGPGRGGMGMDRMLLKGITLTADQQAKVEALNKSEREQMAGGGGRAEFEAMRAAREKGDTATMNKLMAEQRTKMEARRDQQINALRAILTPDQQATFDANVAEMKKMQAQRGMGAGMGMGGGRRGRPPV